MRIEYRKILPHVAKCRRIGGIIFASHPIGVNREPRQLGRSGIVRFKQGLARTQAFEIAERIGGIALAIEVEHKNAMSGVGQKPSQMAGDRGFTGAALLYVNSNGPHALEAPIRTVVIPMVIATIIGIRARIASALLIGGVTAPGTSTAIFAIAGEDSPRNQDK
ncbi:hypothetical protein BSY17_4144 (plasmid) [Sphingobium sp. RAC03]|nr:hypothetical protein BSY17_4144 [Sphingobium sp. RAC03]